MAVIHPFPAQREDRAAHAGPRAPVAANDAAIGGAVATVFHEPWWLDAVTSRRWQAAEVRDGGRLAGWMPYAVTRHRGFEVSVMPPLTHVLGPVIETPHASGKPRWLRQFALVQELAHRLPRVSHFSQTFHPLSGDLLAFQSAGFESFVQFSAEMEALDERAHWAALRDNVRNAIRRAQEQIAVEVLADPRELSRFYRDNLEAAGERSWFDVSLLAPLAEAALAKSQARILAARDGAGRLVAAVLYVWDRSRLWYFLSTRDPRRAANGAVSLLLWRGMRLAAERRLVFDFDGIASEGAARFYGSFGARIRPRYAVWRRSVAYALFTSALDAVRGRSNRNAFVAP